MKKYSASELAEIIEKHGKWLRNEDGGKIADLRYADLRAADLRAADLRYADLRSANLRSANLRAADLRYADLRSADLRYADLRSANLRAADLRYADLRYADLRSADLRSANLRNLIGNLHEIKSIQCDLWMVTYTSEILSIGCQSHKISEWWAFSDDEIASMDSQALAWWKVWKPILKKIIKVSTATPIILDEE